MSLLRRKKKLSYNAIKEAFDDLPSGVCYFDANGFPTLCNRTMHRLVFLLTNKDLQHISDLKEMLSKNSLTCDNLNNICKLNDDSFWRFTANSLIDDTGAVYTEYIASNVTELCMGYKTLESDNKKLRDSLVQLHKLSANVLAATREEEILSLKMRVHDQWGRCLIAARQILIQNRPINDADSIVAEWKNASELINKQNDEPNGYDMLDEIVKASAGMIDIVLDGTLPPQTESAYMIVAAIRECTTNALRHAGATKLFVQISCTESFVTAVITNNGTPPCTQIHEGGGLSSLRKRIEKGGGSMTVISVPAFSLTLRIPIWDII